MPPAAPKPNAESGSVSSGSMEVVVIPGANGIHVEDVTFSDTNKENKKSSNRDEINANEFDEENTRAELFPSETTQHHVSKNSKKTAVKTCMFRVKQTPQFLWNFKWEIAVLVMFVVLMCFNHRAGFLFLIMEVIFDVSLVLALFVRFYLKNFTWGFACFMLNRIVAIAMPTAVLVYTLVWDVTGDKPWVTYLICGLDYFVTFVSFFVFLKYFCTVRIRAATVDDLDGLREIEKVAFPIDEQQASAATIIKRITTAPGTVIVAEHYTGELVGSLYLRPVKMSEVEENKPSWKTLENRSDFTYIPGHHDALYGIGLQGKKFKGIGDFMEMGATACMIRLGLRGIMGGLRIPEYHKSDLPLQEFVRSGKDRLLNKFIHSTPKVLNPTVLCGLPDYWHPDPDSRDCGALCVVYNPVYSWGWIARRPVAYIFHRFAPLILSLSL